MDNIAERAARLLLDDVFQSVVKKQQEGYISLILNSDENDIDVRERANIKYRAIEEFVASLQSLADSPKIEKKRLRFF